MARNITAEPPILDYAPAPPRRRLTTIITPFNIGCLAAMFVLSALVLPYDVGSGRVIVNPYRVATAALAVACVILYALLRIWNDPGASPTRRVLLSLCFLVSVFSFVMAHLSVWGRTRLPPFEMRFEFWRLIAIAAATVLIACAYCSVSWCVRKRPDARL